MNEINAIESARKSAGLRLRDIGEAIGRSGEWVRLVERGRIVVSEQIQKHILQAITELVELRTIEISSRSELFKDRRIQRGRVGKMAETHK